MGSAASIQIDEECDASCAIVSDDIVFGKGKMLMEHDRQYDN